MKAATGARSATVTSIDGTKIAFDRSGRGPALILVDGALGYREYMGSRPLAAALAETFTVVAYDRRGRGQSTDIHPYAVEREIEDLAALMSAVGAPSYVYGFSSGAVLALRAAAMLGCEKVTKLALLEPPFNALEFEREPFLQYCTQTAQLLLAGRRSDAVSLFLQDMLPPEVIDELKQSAEWAVMEAVAPTLAYDNALMGDGSVPRDLARSVLVSTLVLDGSESPAFKQAAADAVARAVPNAQRRTLPGETTLVSPEVLAPILRSFFQAPS